MGEKSRSPHSRSTNGSEFSTIISDDIVTVPSHAERLLRNLNQLRQKQNLCDTELICEDRTFHVHRAVLASGSEYFLNYFDRWVADPNERKVEIKSVNASALDIILDYLYNGVLHVSSDTVVEVFIAADKFMVEEAIYVCLTKLHSSLNLENCVSILNLSLLYSLPTLKDAAIELICTEPLVSVCDKDKLSDLSWTALKEWLMENIEIVDIRITCLNIMQIRDGIREELITIFGDYCDKSIRNMLTLSVQPTALAILTAARHNALNIDCDTDFPTSSPKNNNSANDKDIPENNIAVRSPKSISKHDNYNASTTCSSCNSDSKPVPTNQICSIPPKYPNSRLWTMSPNLAGSSDDTSELYDEYFTATKRITNKKRKVDTSSSTKHDRRSCKIYLLGGCNSTMSTVRTIFRHIQPFNVVTGVSIARYNLTMDLSSPDNDWEQSGYLSTLSHDRTAVAVGSKAYVIGGKDSNNQFLTAFEEFDLKTNTSKLLDSVPNARGNAVAVRIGCHIYVVGGRNFSTGVLCQYLVDRYNIITNTWDSVASCDQIGYNGGAAACNGLLYTFCGERPYGKPSDTVMLYEPHSNSWSPQPTAPQTMSSCQAATCRRLIYVLTSEYKSILLYQYNPEARLWCRVTKHEPLGMQPQEYFIMSTAMVTHQGYLYMLLFMCEGAMRVIRLQKFDTATTKWDIISTKPVPLQHCAVVFSSYNVKTGLS